MASGIYQLEFETGHRYIGKSVDIATRWKQHTEKLQKGTAAKPMMEAYAASGFTLPQGQVLLECHPDLLDLYEGMYINLYTPELNTAIPTRREAWEYEQLEKYTRTDDGMVMGLPALINTVFEFDTTNKDLKLSRARAVRELGELQSSWDDEEFKQISKEERYASIESEALERIRVAQAKVNKMQCATWWQRLWKTW